MRSLVKSKTDYSVPGRDVKPKQTRTRKRLVDYSPSMDRVELGKRLKAMRERTGLSGEKFGAALGKSQGYVSKAETGTVGIDIDEINAWAGACGEAFVPAFTDRTAPVVADPFAPVLEALRGLDDQERAYLLRLATALPRMTREEQDLEVDYFERRAGIKRAQPVALTAEPAPPAYEAGKKPK